MKTLSISISEADYMRFNFTSEKFEFEEFIRSIKKELAKKSLRRGQRAAQKAGLSQMSMEDINAEIQAVRRAKNRS